MRPVVPSSSQHVSDHVPEQPAARADAWSPADDVSLVVAAQGGDTASFDALYRRHARTVRAVLLGRATRDDVDDLVQEAFLAGWRQLLSLRDPAAFGGWMLTIARHLRIDHARRHRPTESLDDAGGDAGTGLSRASRAWVSDAREDERASERIEAQRALEAIRTLPDAYRETLVLRLVEGMTGPEIARRTGLKPESVRVNLCRGMKLLREVLSPAESGATSTARVVSRWPVPGTRQ